MRQFSLTGLDAALAQEGFVSATPNLNEIDALATPGCDEFVLSLPGWYDLGLPVAAARAGACGVLDLTCAPQSLPRAAIVERFRATAASARIGLLLDGAAFDDDMAALAAIGPCDAILLAPAPNINVAELAARCKQIADRVGLVATSAAEAQLAVDLQFDFVVAKGHEAGGFVGEMTTFVLLQQLIPQINLPIFAWGGIGTASAAACQVAGAAGVVLDWQLALTCESPLDKSSRRRIAAMDGSETLALRLGENNYWRSIQRPGAAVSERLQSGAQAHRASDGQSWHAVVRSELNCPRAGERLLIAGQDACFAQPWSAASPTVARALQSFRKTVAKHVAASVASSALRPHSPLAQSHGTEFPIVQGPMTRVSDVPAFVDAVERGGGLPFLALALMRGDEIRKLLSETRDLLGDRPWGVGILGFVPRELRDEQSRVIEEFRPKFAIIAGGRPDQAAVFEAQGITTYLHVPSPGMLDVFIRGGARRFIFEGRECGGHVGPRTSFVLWESMLRVLLAADLSPEETARVHVLFAGGVHDALSAAMVSTLAQPLVERGMKVGVVVGTGYLFTEEIVGTGAVVDAFQQVSLAADRTVLVETGPGHAIRCAKTDYTEFFETEKSRLKAQQHSPEEVRDELERVNMGRLRIASKGITRALQPQPGGSPFTLLDGEHQRREGMYMLGQVAALHRRTTTIRDLHTSISSGSTQILAAAAAQPRVEITPAETPAPQPLDIAIVGMGCLMPGALDVRSFWQNVLDARDAIGEIPPERFDHTRWFDADRHARDRIYSKWGGFLPDLPFDPLRFGIPPAALASIEPMQLLALLLVEQALTDAGYRDDNPHKARTSVILGVGGGAAELGGHYALRSMLPRFFTETPEELLAQLPEWTEDSFAGILLNVVAGRVSNRFDLGGANFTIDAACASSLAAIYTACRELSAGAADMVIAGGCDTIQSPFGYLCFSKTGALSPRGRSRSFDASADGIAISEGHAAIVLKRRADAERDGDRIYAVIKGVAGASDGRSMGLTAPRVDGQLRTLERAYAQARIAPRTVGLFEAHGTGTAVGDQTECQALTTLLTRDAAPPRSVALGGVKSMIGHTKCAAGVIGLIKSAMALYHRVLPPTMHVEKPNPKGGLTDGPLYVNSQSRPWLASGHPRRAGVSAFGFGGSNFHAVLEEYVAPSSRERSARRQWPAELFAFRSVSRERLARSVTAFAKEISAAHQRGVQLTLADLAYTLLVRQEKGDGAHGAAIVAKSIDELQSLLAALATRLNDSKGAGPLRPGIYYGERPADGPPQVAFLFPGQGSQFPGMLRELALEFREVAESFEQADRALHEPLSGPLSRIVFPPPAFTSAEREASAEQLKQTEHAQPALGAASVGMLRLLAAFGVEPHFVAGHSYGELVALHAAGCLSENDLYRLSLARGRAMRDAIQSSSGGEAGAMLAVLADATVVSAKIAGRPDLWLANLNSPRQTVISGTRAAIADIAAKLQADGVESRPIAVACAFHSPLVSNARTQYEQFLANIAFATPQLPTFSNTTAAAYESDAHSIRVQLAEQLVREVRFSDEIRALHKAGATVFVEVGPNRVLTRFVAETLHDQPHAAIATGGRGDDDLPQLLRALGEMFAIGVPADLGRLYEGRDLNVLNLAEVAPPPAHAKHVWLVNGSYARPAHAPPRDTSPQFVVRSAGEPATAEPERLLTLPPPTAFPTPTHLPESTMTAANHQAHTNGASRDPSFMGTTQAAPRAIAASAAPLPGEDAAYAEFQLTMRCFLETQEAVMRAFYGSNNTTPPLSNGSTNGYVPPAADVLRENLEPVVSAPGEFVEPNANAWPMTETPEMVATAESVSPHEEVLSAPPPADVLDREALQEALITVVSERTGYPSDMLDVGANMEAELGIDSIKRVEIIGAFRRKALPAMSDPPSEFMEQMAAAKTMTDILAVIVNYLAAQHTTPATRTALSPAPTAQTSAPQKSLDEDELLLLLTNTVSQRTGYPVDMLDLDANLEGELGIDSIKRVEIISAFRREAIPWVTEPPPEFMERMTAAKTIRMILDVVLSFLRRDESSSTTPVLPPVASTGSVTLVERHGHTQPAAVVNEATVNDATSPRCVAAAIETPLLSDGPFRPASGVIVITDDGQGFAAQFATELAAAQVRAVVLPELSLQSAAATRAAIDSLRVSHEHIAGVVHLLPLASAPSFPEISASEWEEFRQREVLGLLYLLQAVAPELKASSTQPAAVISVSRGGGDFLLAGTEECAHPWRGGLSGLLKVAQREWPEANFRALDIDELPTPQRLLEEMTDREFVEIGYRHGRRLSLQAIRKELTESPSTKPEVGLDKSSVVLVTGGARGITAEVAEEIARKTQATFVLLGRSPLPHGDEDSATAALVDPVALRRALVTNFQELGVKPSPKDIEEGLRSLLAAREIRRTLAALRGAGSKVEYIACDVRDAAALTEAVEQVQQRHGKIDAVIHGAGIIEDRFIVDKSAESFERVQQTKLQPLLTLCRVLDPQQLKLLMLFSSTSGFFGNAGQCDYAAANEILNRIARRLDDLWPAKVASMNWGPWSGAGMVTPEVAKQFHERGVGMVTVPGGRRAARLEAEYCHNDGVRIVVGPGAWIEHADRLAAALPEAEFIATTPLLGGSTIRRFSGGSIETQVELTPELPYLDDHRIDDKPVLPLAVATAMLAELAHSASRKSVVVEVADLRQFQGIIIDGPRLVIRIVGEPLGGDRWRMKIVDWLRPARIFYQAEVQLAASYPPAPSAVPLGTINGGFPKSVSEAYLTWMFHDRTFWLIDEFHGVASHRIDATMHASQPELAIGPAVNGEWTIDGVALDVAPQMIGFWSRARFDITPLPNRIAAAKFFGSLAGGPLRCIVQLHGSSNGRENVADVYYVRDGHVVAQLMGLEAVGSAELNRITGALAR